MSVGPRYGLLRRLYQSIPSFQLLADPRTWPNYAPRVVRKSFSGMIYLLRLCLGYRGLPILSSSTSWISMYSSDGPSIFTGPGKFRNTNAVLAKQNGAAWSLPWRWISGRWCHGSGKVGEWSALMVFAPLSPCYVAKMGEMSIVRL